MCLTDLTSRCILGGLPSSTFIGMSTGGAASLSDSISCLFFRRHADHGKGATLTLAESLELRQRFRRDRHHIAFLALVAPDFLGRKAAFLERDGAQVELRAAPGVVHEFGEGIGQAAGAHVVDGQDRVGRAQLGALVDDFLGPALDFRVAALHRIEVKLGRVGAWRPWSWPHCRPCRCAYRGRPAGSAACRPGTESFWSSAASIVPTPPAIMMGLW